jgi:dTDP-D-glucose 4,6-dehydratase
MTILVTGAAGFIGSNFVLDWFQQSKEDVVSLDLLTFAGNLVCVIQGEVFDTAVDVRRFSPTFGKWVGEVL